VKRDSLDYRRPLSLVSFEPPFGAERFIWVLHDGDVAVRFVLVQTIQALLNVTVASLLM
jgi:hypothetical protein